MTRDVEAVHDAPGEHREDLVLADAGAEQAEVAEFGDPREQDRVRVVALGMVAGDGLLELGSLAGGPSAPAGPNRCLKRWGSATANRT